MEAISKLHGVAMGTLRTWHYEFKWKQRRQEIAAALRSKNEGALQAAREKHNVLFLQSTAKLIQQLTGAASQELERPPGERDLKRVAECLKVISKAGSDLLLPAMPAERSGDAHRPLGGGPFRARPLNVNVLVAGRGGYAALDGYEGMPSGEKGSHVASMSPLPSKARVGDETPASLTRSEPQSEDAAEAVVEEL